MTTWATDDLAQIMIAPDREHVGYAQGILRAWDPDTFSNVVEVRGGTLTDLPVASGVEALTYQAGDVLMLTRWKLRSGRGAASYWIGSGGRVIFPGTGAAAQQVAFLRGELAKNISAEVFASRVHAAQATSLESTTSSMFVALPGGPTLSDVEVSDSRTLIVLVGSEMIVSGDHGASMSFEVSGATTVAPNSNRAHIMDYQDSDIGTGIANGALAGVVLDVNPGTHTIEARYNRRLGSTEDVSFINRTLIAIGL